MKRLLCMLPALLWGCAEQVAGGGGGIETGNALAIRIVDSTGAPARGAKVRMLPIGYRATPGDETLPASAHLAVADSLGWIRDTLPSESYRLEASLGSLGAWWSLDRMPDDQDRGPILLRRKGSVRGKALLPAGSSRAWIRIPGRPSGVWTDTAGNFHLDSLPPGDIEIEADFQPLTGSATIKLLPSSHLDVDIAPTTTSLHTDTLFLDAAQGGTQAAVTAFPLLIRLDSSWFPFATARPDGADLRITCNGKVLPMEIERWNASLGKAEIWVRLDVPARDSIPLVLGWGSSQPGISRGTSVFRSEDGFQAVWHLADGHDASGQVAPLALSQTSGISSAVAQGVRFSSDSASQVSWNWAGARAAMQCDAWVLPQGTGLSFDAFLSGGAKGPRLHRSGDEAGACFTLPGTIPGDTSGSVGACSQFPLNDGLAHLVTGQWARDTLFLYVDGIRQGIQPLSAAALDSMPLYLGRHPDGMGAFTGWLDEVRLQNTARSTDWIRLSWATQRTGSTLLRRRVR